MLNFENMSRPEMIAARRAIRDNLDTLTAIYNTTLAARTAAIISQVRRYTVTRYTCPGRQIIVSPSTRTPGGWQVTFYHTDRITGDMEPSYHTDCDTLEKVAAEIPHSFCAADAVA